MTTAEATLPGCLARLRRWYCRVAHRDLWIYLPWGTVCGKCGRVVREEKGEKG